MDVGLITPSPTLKAMQLEGRARYDDERAEARPSRRRLSEKAKTDFHVKAKLIAEFKQDLGRLSHRRVLVPLPGTIHQDTIHQIMWRQKEAWTPLPHPMSDNGAQSSIGTIIDVPLNDTSLQQRCVPASSARSDSSWVFAEDESCSASSSWVFPGDAKCNASWEMADL